MQHSQTEKQFYYMADGQRFGPFRLEQLAEQPIERATPIWTKGMSDWRSAETLPELLSIVPPPIPDAVGRSKPPVTASGALMSAEGSNSKQAVASRWNGFGIGLATVGFVAGAIAGPITVLFALALAQAFGAPWAPWLVWLIVLAPIAALDTVELWLGSQKIWGTFGALLSATAFISFKVWLVTRSHSQSSLADAGIGPYPAAMPWAAIVIWGLCLASAGSRIGTWLNYRSRGASFKSIFLGDQ